MLDLDWKKGKRPEADAAVPPIDPAALQYKQSRKSLEDLIGLIIDMIGRGVDELKIAQTIMFRNQGENSEEDIIQTVEAIKEFVALCVSGKFKGLPRKKICRLKMKRFFIWQKAMPRWRWLCWKR